MEKKKLLNKKGQTEEEFLAAYNPGKYERPSVTVDMLIFTKRNKENLENPNSKKLLQLLMIKRGDHPYLGCWALPGGFVNMDESLEAAARRDLKEETHLENIPMEQLYTWGDVGRDPRTRVISTSYMTMVDSSLLDVKADDDADDADWFTVSYLPYQEEVNNTKNKSMEQKLYRLKLTSGKNEISAIINAVDKSADKTSGVRLSIVSSDGIAFDHAKIIAYALERLFH